MLRSFSLRMVSVLNGYADSLALSLKGAVSPIFSVHLNSQKVYFYEC